MRVIDISVPLSEDTPSWPGEDGFKAVIQRKHGAVVSLFSLGSHVGTHIDAPRHFIEEGQCVDQLSMEDLVGEARVCHLLGRNIVGLQDLKCMKLEGTKRLLLRTDNSMRWNERGFYRDYVALDVDAAQYIVDLGVRLVGIDYLSIEAFDSSESPVHRILLGSGVAILEGLDLSCVDQGLYNLVALPLRILGADGAPARAILTQ